MKLKTGITIKLTIILVSAVIFIICSILCFIQPGVQKGNQIWKGYYLFIYNKSTPASVISGFLDKGGFKYISEENCTVGFSNYNGLETVSVSEIKNRLDVLDPRYDSFLKKVPRLFSTHTADENMNIIYIQSNQNPLCFYLSLYSALKGFPGYWEVKEYNYLKQLLFLIYFLVFYAIVIYKSKLNKEYLYLSILPWALILFYGNFSVFISSLIISLFWTKILEIVSPPITGFLNNRIWNIERDKIIKAGFLLLFAVFVIIPVQSGNFYCVIPVILSLTANIALFINIKVIYVFKRIKNEHELFFPVKIISSDIGKRSIVFYWQMPVLFALIVFSPLIISVPGTEMFEVPCPKYYPEINNFSWNDLEQLSRYETDKNLPDLSSYLTHIAFQESFSYMRNYKFPYKGEKIQLSRFFKHNYTIIREKKVVKEFTEEWYVDILSQASTWGFLKLFLNQSRPAGVFIESVEKYNYNTFFYWRHFAFCFIVFLPLLCLNNKINFKFINNIKRLILRREHQEI